MKERRHPLIGVLQLLASCCFACLGAWPSVPGDEVRVQGTVLRGKVLEVTDSGLVLRTDYGKGDITIAYEDIESLSTDGVFLILFGKTGEVWGRLIGVEEGMLLVGEDPVTATRVVTSSIVDSDTEDEAASLSERIRNYLRFWKASLDLGIVLKDSTTDEFDLTLGARFERRQTPTRLLGEIQFLYEVDKDPDESADVTDNEVIGVLKGEYDYTPHWFAYTQHYFEYDEPDEISFRWVGRLGPGYRFIETERYLFQVESGIAYVYERFFGGDVEEYAGVPFSAEGRVGLVYDAALEFRVAYIASLQDWVNDILILSKTTLDLPITRYLSFRTTIQQTYDSTPAPDYERSEVKLILSIAWRF